MEDAFVHLPRNENQARLLGRYAIEFLREGCAAPDEAVERMTERFLTDSIACAVSALALGTNAPTTLRREALEYAVSGGRQDQGGEFNSSGFGRGATCLGSAVPVAAEKAVLANCSAAREWDANGTNFGYNPSRGQTRGEFGHNDFYPVAIAAAEQTGANGRQTLLGMILLDEIRGRLAEAFSLKEHKIDHVLHGAIASAAVYGAMIGATEEQIESALGLVVAHHVPFRAIRAGKQLSDSKGASAAISAEAAVCAARRARRGFVGPADIFRNPEGVFCLYQKPARAGESPFDLWLARQGSDFAVMGMHFKLGLYEHQSAGAIQGLIDLLGRHAGLLEGESQVRSIRITTYQPAFGIIGDPAKRDPRTRQSADHSMVYIVATLFRKAIELGRASWEALMLVPADYDEASLVHPVTRRLMLKIEFRHGGPDFDRRYPDGIPTTLEIDHERIGQVSSGLVMYPEGHARDSRVNLDRLLTHKFRLLAGLGVRDPDSLFRRFSNLASKSPAEIRQLHDFEIAAP